MCGRVSISLTVIIIALCSACFLARYVSRRVTLDKWCCGVILVYLITLQRSTLLNVVSNYLPLITYPLHCHHLGKTDKKHSCCISLNELLSLPLFLFLSSSCVFPLFPLFHSSGSVCSFVTPSLPPPPWCWDGVRRWCQTLSPMHSVKNAGRL